VRGRGTSGSRVLEQHVHQGLPGHVLLDLRQLELLEEFLARLAVLEDDRQVEAGSLLVGFRLECGLDVAQLLALLLGDLFARRRRLEPFGRFGLDTRPKIMTPYEPFFVLLRFCGMHAPQGVQQVALA
jgi:hypothetical protein